MLEARVIGLVEVHCYLVKEQIQEELVDHQRICDQSTDNIDCENNVLCSFVSFSQNKLCKLTEVLDFNSFMVFQNSGQYSNADNTVQSSQKHKDRAEGETEICPCFW